MPRQRVTRLASVHFAVPAPECTAAFLRDGVGMLVHPGSLPGGQPTWEATTHGEYGLAVPRAMLTLEAGSQFELRGVTFDIDAAFDRDALRQRLSEHGITATDGPDEATSFTDPAGVAVTCASPGPALEAVPAMPLGPRRIGHVNLTVADPSAEAAFYCHVLGARLSEQIGEAIYFLRIGSEHHNIGIRQGGPVAGAHHVGFEVHGWESYRPICDHLADQGYKIEFGPGRHGPGNNLFTYVCDPSSGLRIELYADMAHIHDEASYVPARWQITDRPNTVNRWGPGPPESFLR